MRSKFGRKANERIRRDAFIGQPATLVATDISASIEKHRGETAAGAVQPQGYIDNPCRALRRVRWLRRIDRDEVIVSMIDEAVTREIDNNNGPGMGTNGLLGCIYELPKAGRRYVVLNAIPDQGIAMLLEDVTYSFRIVSSEIELAPGVIAVGAVADDKCQPWRGA